MSNKPTPKQEYVDQLLDTIEEMGGSAGNKKLQETLGLSDQDYTWIKEYVVDTGKVVPGRGRGGSLKLPNMTSAPPKPKKELNPDPPEEKPLEEIQAKYKKLPDDISAFKVGMKIIRPMLDMFSEDYAWRHARTYKVTQVDRDRLYVVPHPNRKKEPELSALPRDFYEKQ